MTTSSTVQENTPLLSPTSQLSVTFSHSLAQDSKGFEYPANELSTSTIINAQNSNYGTDTKLISIHRPWRDWVKRVLWSKCALSIQIVINISMLTLSLFLFGYNLKLLIYDSHNSNFGKHSFKVLINTWWVLGLDVIVTSVMLIDCSLRLWTENNWILGEYSAWTENKFNISALFSSLVIVIASQIMLELRMADDGIKTMNMTKKYCIGFGIARECVRGLQVIYFFKQIYNGFIDLRYLYGGQYVPEVVLDTTPRQENCRSFMFHKSVSQMITKRKHEKVSVSVAFEPRRFGFIYHGNTVIAILPGTQADVLGIRSSWKIASINGKKQPNDHDIISKEIEKAKNSNQLTTILFEQEHLANDVKIQHQDNEESPLSRRIKNAHTPSHFTL